MLPATVRVHVSSHDGRDDQVVDRKDRQNASSRRRPMTKTSHFVTAAFALATLASLSFASAPAQAAEVACKTGGAVQGCVAATSAPVVVAPAAPVATTTVAHAAYIAPAPVAVTHTGYTRVTPYGVRHVGTTCVWR
jgi:hypothetical protein